MHIKITPTVYEDLFALAGARNDTKRVLNKYSKFSQDPGHDSRFAHLVGVLGEYATARVLGGDIDRAIYTLAGDGGVGDVTLRFGGQKIEVKTRRFRDCDFALASTDPAKFRAAFAVLVWPGIQCPNALATPRDVSVAAYGPGLWMDVVGYLTRQDFFRLASRVDYGHGERLAVAPEHFRPLTLASAPVSAARLLQEAY